MTHQHPRPSRRARAGGSALLLAVLAASACSTTANEQQDQGNPTSAASAAPTDASTGEVVTSPTDDGSTEAPTRSATPTPSARPTVAANPNDPTDPRKVGWRRVTSKTLPVSYLVVSDWVTNKKSDAESPEGRLHVAVLAEEITAPLPPNESAAKDIGSDGKKVTAWKQQIPGLRTEGWRVSFELPASGDSDALHMDVLVFQPKPGVDKSSVIQVLSPVDKPELGATAMDTIVRSLKPKE